MKLATGMLILFSGLLATPPALAFDPITGTIGKGISTALDVRSKADVKADVEIDISLTKRLVEQRRDDFGNVSLLVFSRHGVLVGFARSDEIRRKAGEIAATEKRLRSLRNDIVIGHPQGNMAGNAVLDKKIDLALTATKGVHSVNLRWKSYGGDVFLTGIAKTPTEANLAKKTIMGLDGVRAVHSSLRIGRTG